MLASCAAQDEEHERALGPMPDWHKIVPMIQKLMNEFARAEMYPTTDEGLLAYQKSTRYVPPRPDSPVPETKTKSNKWLALGETEQHKMLAL